MLTKEKMNEIIDTYENIIAIFSDFRQELICFNFEQEDAEEILTLKMQKFQIKMEAMDES